MAADSSLSPFVVMELSIGPVVFELYTRHAPLTCRNFAELARTGYYDGTTFHRVIPGFMAQGGDPSGTGRGGASIYGGKFKDEITRELKHVGAGVLSMANSGPNSNGSQFFVLLAPAPWLDGKHTIFGRVCAGMGTIKKLGMVPTDDSDRPLDAVSCLKAYPSSSPNKPEPAGQRGLIAPPHEPALLRAGPR